MAEVKSWASILDEATRRQADMLARAPGIAGHVALMPDAHLGKGATVGSVIPTYLDTIIPAAVGVDIGCGMIAVRLNKTREDLPDDLSPIMGLFQRSIPAGSGTGAPGPRRKLAQHPGGQGRPVVSRQPGPGPRKGSTSVEE